jgi:carbon-monoxide dehydrogenase iron sulfur subunit
MAKKVYTNFRLCTGCELCAAACSVTKFKVNNPRKSGIIIKRDLFERYEVQHICRHCEEPPCVEACISGAMTKNAQSGLVEHDSSKCVGCWSCMTACPYDAIVQIRLEAEDRMVAFKCDGCPERDTPACVEVCPTEALVYQ